ncbi:restriction endonuclease subunit S [Tenacibaculum finnmarkense]|uniref:restriction endonuclease subunit S n=1 Tax=Tenacibaculum finnmarkense TaxID=2781243 RepID=UPI000C470A90|nr:restriction endonuclease subunit S [Tenacibaculum finnmarkense]MCD8439963.1 restriction endonuclease subunit S [Tenacibaculum finnmarkense genomovar ulcerans]MCG8720846.1 hypothetical protein [Tenacibaculum finnmarkense]SOS54446.1 Type I restriction enzyme ZgaDI, S subunit [Tenacibaculum finnmarkense]
MESKLPKNWVNSNIEDSIEILDNKRKPVSASERAKRLGEIPYYGSTGVAGKIDDYIFNEELVLLGEDGAPFLDYSKNVAYMISGKSWVNNHAHVLKARINITSNQFLLHYLNQFNYTNYVGGTTRLKLNQGNLKSIPFPLPPLAEQQRIVAKLDTLFGSLDALKIRLLKVPQLIKNFKQAVLTQAVTGKLTQEWRVGKELEYASLLNKNNQVEFEIINFDFLPNNWLKTALGNYANCSRGKFSVRPRNDPRYFDGNYPFMQIGDLPREGGYTSDYSKTLNEEGIKVSKSFPKGTVVVAIVGATIGLTGILEKEMFFPDSLIGLNCENFISNQYLEYYLRLCKNGFREISYAGGGQPNIKLPTIKNLELLIPPLKEQTEIVKRVENLFSKADAIENQYKTLKEKIDRLPQAILAKAFKGELVAQLPTDGDAKDLLEEIKKLKESLVVKPKKKVVRNKK